MVVTLIVRSTYQIFVRMKNAAAATEDLSSSFAHSRFICAHTAALWRSVFVYVWEWNRFFCVPEWWCDDGDSSLTCVYMRVREKTRRSDLLQPIMNHNKDLVFNGNTDSRLVEYRWILAKLKLNSLDKLTEVYSRILDVTPTTLNTCKYCLFKKNSN